MAILTYRAALPTFTSADTLERLRGLGSIEIAYSIEALSRREAIRDTVIEMMGWDSQLAEYDWWQENLSRGRRA